MHITSSNKPISKITYCKISIIWHSEKDKTIEIVKISDISKSYGDGRNVILWHYNSRYLSSCICPKPKIVKHQEWILM